MREVDVHEVVRRRLEEQAIRYTKGRRAVVGVLQRAKGPQSASDLHDRLRPGVPLSSIYRSLAVLDQAGIVRRHHDVDGVARFELAEWLAGHHHHLVCVECGAVEDVELADEAEGILNQLAETLGERARYRVSGHALEVQGVCGACRR